MTCFRASCQHDVRLQHEPGTIRRRDEGGEAGSERQQCRLQHGIMRNYKKNVGIVLVLKVVDPRMDDIRKHQ